MVVRRPGGRPGPGGSCINRYPTELMVSMVATTPKASMKAGWRFQAGLGGPGGSSGLAGGTAPGARRTRSYFSISGWASAPTTPAMLRMSSRA